MKKILFILLILSPLVLHAQEHSKARIDSLLPELSKAKEDTNKVNILNDLSFAYRLINTDEGIKYGKEGLELAMKLGWETGIAKANNNLGINYYSKADYPKALEYDLEALKINEETENKKGIAVVTGNIGVVYNALSDYPKALEYDFKALKLNEETGNETEVANVTMGIGNIYYTQGDYSKALEYYLKVLKTDKETGNKTGIADINSSIGNVYYSQSELPKALGYYFNALKIDEETGDKNGIARVTSNIGEIYIRQKNYSIGIEYEHKALRMYEEIADKNGIAYTLSGIGWCFISMLKDTQANIMGINTLPDSAIYYLQQSLLMGKDLYNMEIMQSCDQGLSEVYKLTGNYKKALEYTDDYGAIKDSIFSKENNDKILKMGMKYELAEKDKITALTMQRQRIFIYVGFTVLALVLLLMFFIYRNYTLQKKANAIIRAEKENAEQQRLRAERSEQFEQQFLANMSHEIRTPMNAVLGMTNLTLDTELTPIQTKYLTAVKRSSENLLVIINDVLDLSKLQAGKMELENIPFRLSEQIRQVYETMQFKAEEKGLILQTEIAKDIPDVLTGDPSRLNQVLINLCANAIKFTDKGTVRIIVQKVNGTEATLCFRVIDTGIGIPADKVNKLFESFQQADASTSRKYGGTGLGLSISKTLVELQGGKMEVMSEEGKGSEFFFTITYGMADEKAAASFNTGKKSDHALLSGIRILVAEDNEYNQVVIRDTLKRLIKEVQVDIAENGKIALEKLLANDYDVILMDAQMPEMSGPEAAEFIRKKIKGKKSGIPIIALTASVLSSNLNKCFEAGMNDYIPKPFTRAQLLNTLSKFYTNGLPVTEPMEENKVIEPPTINENPGNKVTDLTFLREFCEGNETTMKEYIDIYLRLTPVNLEKINASAKEKDYFLLSQNIHAIKAHLNYMGMKKARDLADKIELYAAEQTNLAEILELVDKLHTHCIKSIEELSLF